MDRETEVLLEQTLLEFKVARNASELPAAKERVLRWCEKENCAVLPITDPDLFRLREIPDPPRLLFLKGNRELMKLIGIGIVGTRKPTPYGIRAALSFSQTLAFRGFCVISGLAYGVDTAAHEGALRAEGFTVAVLAHGLDRVYPQANRALTERILEAQGCLVSEYPPGVPPLPQHFPRRNRIISGLAIGVLVIEAAQRSGSLITAQSALEQGREVFAIPGAYDDPGYAGSHALIQQGAKLVVTPEDVLCEFPTLYTSHAHLARALHSGETLGEELCGLFQKCGGGASLEELVEQSALGQQELFQKLSLAVKNGIVCEIYPQQYVWVGLP